VENKGLNFALLEGYHTALMKGRYPVCCLFLEISPAEVDVNIHPAKREIKFHRDRAIRQLVAQAVRETLLRFHAAPEKPVTADRISAPERPEGPKPLEQTPELMSWAEIPNRAKEPHARDQRRITPPVQAISSPGPAKISAQTPEASAAPRSMTTFPDASPGQPIPVEPKSEATGTALPQASPVISSEPVPLLHVPLRLLGVVGRLYVVLESDRGLVLLDQIAAHERILFEQMLQRLENQGNAPSQRLLLPETVELSARDSQFLREQLATLTRLGVGLNEFGERTFLLDALPPFVRAGSPRRFILELVDELKAAGQAVNTLRLGEQTIAKTVCRHAVKANDPLAGPELERLVDDLRHCIMPYTCPHGRPTLIEMNYRELEKKFGRTQ